jgi:excisionase family DNA binding protein
MQEPIENERQDSKLTANEVGELLGVHSRTVRRMAHAGVLQHLRVGTGRGILRFRASDVLKFLGRSERAA